VSELHPQARQLLAAVATRAAAPITELDVETARRQALADLPLAGESVAVDDVEDVQVDALRLRIYRPPPRPRTALVFLHGGGWVTGGLDLADPQCRALASACRAVVVSVDYRLAPEHPYPAGLEDAWRAVRWTLDHAAELGVDADRVAIGGDSAGGNLAAAACLLARDHGTPRIAAQVLIYPVTDRACATPSWRRYGNGFWLDRAEMEWYWARYLRHPDDAAAPYVSVLRCADLTGLPPALVYTAGCDPLRDEGEAYAARLVAAGVPTYARRFPGQLHGFFSCAAVVDAAAELAADVGAWLPAAAQ
jgi:acetyl esterase